LWQDGLVKVEAGMIELANALRADLAEAAVRFRRLGEADVTRDRGAGKWVKKEILGHLIDSAANNHQRFVRAQFASPFVWPGYDQQAWVPLHRYRDRPWGELVDLWVGLNRHIAAVIESVPAEKLPTPCTIGDHEAMSLEWWMRDYLRHLRHHLAQLGER
jgi:DinB superfamily